MITMLLGGLWHGAAWNFVLWGFYQGILLCIYRAWTEIRRSQPPAMAAAKFHIGDAKLFMSRPTWYFFYCLLWLAVISCAFVLSNFPIIVAFG